MIDASLAAGVRQYACYRFAQAQHAVRLTEQQHTTIGGDVATLKIGFDYAPFTRWKFKRFLCTFCHGQNLFDYGLSTCILSKYRGFAFFIGAICGLDVSLRSVSVCIVDNDGAIQLEGKVDSEVEAIVACLNRFDSTIKSVGFEAGALTQYLTYGLQAAGYEVICLEARQVSSAFSAMRNKTDKNEARGIAQILRTGWYSRVHVKSFESHLIRALLTGRKAVLKKCVDLENEIRGLIRIISVKLPGTLKHGIYDVTVREIIENNAILADALIPLLDARLVLYKTYLKLDNQAKAMVREDPICQRLTTVPGVGAITALTHKAAVDDPTRFKHSRTVAAHFGLTPRRFQSGEVDNTGRISKAGDPEVRSALYVAAHSLVVRSAEWSSLKIWGLRLAKTKDHRRAVTAVARKLAVILHKMWMDGTDFRHGSTEATA